MLPVEPIRFYFYVIVDVSTEPPKPVRLVFTRAEGRLWLQTVPNAQSLRIRRAKATMFER
jgi:hypothetical protein